MGIFDFLKKKKDSNDSLITSSVIKSSGHEVVKLEIEGHKKAGVKLECKKIQRQNREVGQPDISFLPILRSLIKGYT